MMERFSMATYQSRIRRTLISASELQEAIRLAGAEIDREYAGKPLLLVSILKGSFVFLADLARAVSIPCEISFLQVQSYFDGTTSSGTVQLTMDLAQDISRYHVLLVEDIIDSGRTLQLVTELLKKRAPLSFRILTLLDKPARREVPLTPDRALFVIPDVFVIGYGLDCGELYRNLPYIAEYGVEI